METIIKTIDQKHQDIWDFLSEKGLTNSERMKVRTVFVEWARSFNPDVEKDTPKGIYYRNKAFEGYLFTTEAEAEFIGALQKFAPEADREKIMRMIPIITTLLGIESEWKF